MNKIKMKKKKKEGLAVGFWSSMDATQPTLWGRKVKSCV
jgi:hypothetical protein